MAFTHVDCFSGPGGICTGLHAAGFETKVAIEFIESCVETYKKNHPEVHVIHSDIRDVTESQILPFVPEEGIDLVTSGMPCETFSTAGNTSRSFYDDRQFLFREGIRIAKIVNAKMILFENVPAITTKTVSADSSELIVSMLKRELKIAGYGNFIETVLRATDFGVPQKRNRFFILAAKDENWTLSSPEPQTDVFVTVKEALAGLKNVVPNTGKDADSYSKTTSDYAELMKNDRFWKRKNPNPNVVSYQCAMKHRDCTLKRFELLGQGECLKDLFEKYQGEQRESLQKQRILPKKLFIKRNYRLVDSQPSPTLTSHCLDEFVHPKYNRALTVRECARLQSFPDSYDFCGGPFITPHLHNNIQDKYEQIGDAVPPLLAYAWGKKIDEIMRRYVK